MLSILIKKYLTMFAFLYIDKYRYMFKKFVLVVVFILKYLAMFAFLYIDKYLYMFKKCVLVVVFIDKLRIFIESCRTQIEIEDI